MAVDAPAHLQGGDLADLTHVLHLPVALLTWKSLRDVPAMAEVDVIGQAVDPHPGNRTVGIVEGGDLLDIRSVGAHDVMAVHADVDRGDRRMPGALGIRVAVEARDLPGSRVQLVAEGDRLLRHVANIGERVEEGPSADRQEHQDEKRKQSSRALFAHETRLCLPWLGTRE